jgi:signal transduction histidine kinase
MNFPTSQNLAVQGQEEPYAGDASSRDQAAAGLAENALNAEFLSNVAHQLRSPLSSLRVSVDLLKDPAAVRNLEDVSRLMEAIDRAASRLDRQIKDLLEAGYLQAGTLSVNPRIAPLGPAVTAAVGSVEKLARSRKVALAVNIGPEPLQVIADIERVEQITASLLSNAVKFSPVGSTVSVRVYACPDGPSADADNAGVETTFLTRPLGARSYVCVAVHDSGPGVAPTAHRRIFSPFNRGSDNGIAPGGGAGLGLSIALGLVRLNKGAMWVRSSTGMGAEFGFSVPAAVDREVAEA